MASQNNAAALTAAEARILGLVSKGHTSRQIAARLGISHRTVQNHRNNICRKLGLSGPHALLIQTLDCQFRLS